MVKQTAGRDSLGDFAPKFAELNDDVLFGEVWSREDKLSLKMRSILTVTALVSKGLIDSSFQYHAMTAKKNGVTKTEMAEILTHLAFYVGWPNAWSANGMRAAPSPSRRNCWNASCSPTHPRTAPGCSSPSACWPRPSAPPRRACC